MTLLPTFTSLVSPPTCAVLLGGVVRHRGIDALRADLEEAAGRIAKPASRPHFGVIDAGEGLAGAGYVIARAPVAYQDRVKVTFWSMTVQSATIDEASVSIGDRDARTTMDLLEELARKGYEPVDAAAGPAALPRDPEVDETELHLVGNGVLVWGRLLPSEGADYEKGRVRTFRGRVNEDVVRVVGVVVAEASAGAPQRVCAGELASSLWELCDEARPELAAQLEPKDLGFWLLSR